MFFFFFFFFFFFYSISNVFIYKAIEIANISTNDAKHSIKIVEGVLRSLPRNRGELSNIHEPSGMHNVCKGNIRIFVLKGENISAIESSRSHCTACFLLYTTLLPQ